MILLKMNNLGLTSRGEMEEMIRWTADLLHAEEHTDEAIKKESHREKELAEIVDRLRGIRQKTVRLWSGDFVNPNHWCRTKHLIEGSRRGEEIIENAARTNPGMVAEIVKISNEVEKEKNKAIKHFKEGKTKFSDEECFRCEADLGKENYEKLKNLLSETKSLNTSMSKENNNPNVFKKNKKNGGIFMTNWKQLGIINGGQFAGKGITVLADYVDQKYPPADGAIIKRKGLWINVGVGVLGQVAALYGIRNDNLKLLTMIGSSHALTKVVDYAREAMAPGARLPVTRAPLRITPTPRAAPMVPSTGLVQVD